MARENGGRGMCHLHCRRQDVAGDNASTAPESSADHVDWAGLPVNLDLVFSQRQRDKVYVQHLMRKRGAQLWSWLEDGAPPCVCDAAAEARRAQDSADSMSSR